MDITAANRQLVAGESLSRDAMQAVMRQIMSGLATDAQIGAFLTALAIKGESVEEIVGAATMMRELSATVTPRATHLVDCVGTGGDGAKLFNVSTASTLVAAAAGAAMAKHGNRAATSHCGSADVLEAAGVNIAITPEQVAQCIDECGVGFMFAPTHHAATRHVMTARKEIGIRTIFNLLGPLTNPAAARYQVTGVFSQQWLMPLAQVYAAMGSEHTLIVSSDDGLDEISIAADTQAVEYRNGVYREFTIRPAEFDVTPSALAAITVADARASLALIQQALGGARGGAYDIVALNGGATIYVSGLVDSLAAGVARAREILDQGVALHTLAKWVTVSNSFA